MGLECAKKRARAARDNLRFRRFATREFAPSLDFQKKTRLFSVFLAIDQTKSPYYVSATSYFILSF